jgi:uncharacterized protein
VVQKALITGASSGIGKDLALLLADKGIELILHGRDKACLQEVLDAVSKKTRATIFQAELASFEGTLGLLKMLQDELPDLVVNSAGFGLYGDLVDQRPKEVQEMIATNCAALVAITQHMAYWWKEAGKTGTILNISSALSVTPAPGACVYGATKAFVNSFSEALDVELEPYGIRVLTACPGRVATKFSFRASKGKSIALDPGGLLLDPKEVAKDLWGQIESQKVLRIIDWRYRLVCFIRKLLPKRFAMRVLYRRIKSRVE